MTSPDRVYNHDTLLEDVRPTKKELAYLRERIDSQAHRPRALGRLAVVFGLLLIGDPKFKQTHRPTKAHNHTFYDVLDGMQFKSYPEIEGMPYALHASTQVDIAVLTALFGNFNNRRQIGDICEPLTGRRTGNFGWKHDPHKTRQEPYIIYEEALLQTYGDPRLIRAATDPDHPFEGVVHAVRRHPKLVPINLRAGEVIGPVSRQTVASFRVTGRDLPMDMISARYDHVLSIHRGHEND